MRLRALVFDFDGLILDTEGPVYASWCESFEALGCPPPTLEEWAREIGTVGGLDPLRLLRERAGVAFDEDAVQARRRERRDELLASESVRPGVEAWLDEADALGLGLAIASSSEHAWVDAHLTRLEVRHRFAHLACYGDGVAPKPAPDAYLAACVALGVVPDQALGLEDSPHGIAAAKAAGLWCVAVPHALTTALDLSAADVRLGSLADASLSTVMETLGRVRS